MFETTSPLSRYAFGILFSFGMTFGLLLIMYAAIDNEEAKIHPTPSGTLVPIVRILPDEPVEENRRDVDPPPPVIPEPERRQPQFEDLAYSEVTATEWRRHEPVLELGSGRADGDFLPYMTVAPEYPPRQLARGVEGWVVIEFSVDELGRVVNPKVITSHPGNGFNRAALDAVKRYKYKPRVVNGKAVPVHGVRQRISFNLSA